MVNGKPTLTFGDNQYTTPAKNQQRPDDAKVRNTKALKAFASYLPVTEAAPQAKARPKQATPAAAQASAPAVLQTKTESRRSGATPPAAASAVTMPAYQPAGIQTPLAGYRDANLPGGAALAGAGQQNAALRSPQALQYALPPGGNSRVAAREYARSSLENFQGNISPGATAARLSQKNMPGIPSRTVPGRYGFGMVDTRKIPDDPAATQAQTRSASKNIDRGYTGYAGNTAGGQGEKSFVTHGFGGGNAAFALRSLGYNIRESQPNRTYARRLDSDSGIVMGPSGQVLGRSRGMAVDGGEDAASMSVMPGSQRRKSGEQGPAFSYPGRSLLHSLYNIVDNSFGSLAAKFESGAEGISAIGYDSRGGTSYGKYQIASRVGTMAAFIDYLDEKAPDFAKRLRSAGPANTGGRSGKMPAEWRKIASEEPARFEKLQEDFIRTSHFEPAMRSITESTGLGFANMPTALQEVLFSTAVQHGPLGAVRIFNQALSSVGVNKLQTTGKLVTESFKRAGRQLIKQVYALRAGQFMASSSGVQASVRNRLHQEMNEALGMLV